MPNRQLGIGAVLGENVLCDRCAIAAGNVILCPLHAAAEEMRALLATRPATSLSGKQYDAMQAWQAKVDALLAKVEG